MRPWLVALVLLGHGCGAGSRAVRNEEAGIDLALVEASRDAGRVVLRTSPALRALGRIGGPRSAEILRSVLVTDKDETARSSAIEALWFADEPGSGADVARAAAGASPRLRVTAVRALGRLGSSAEEPVLLEALRDLEPEVRRAAGIAAGIYGRRKLPVSDGLVAALIENAAHEDAGVRYGAAYGLSHHPNPAGSAALERLAGDADAETRALALAGISRRGVTDPSIFSKGLTDRNVWVQVEAVKGLSAPQGTPEMRAILAGRLFEAADGHMLREGLTRLLPFAKEEAVGAAFGRWAGAGGALGCYGKAGLVRREAPLSLLRDCPYEGQRFLADAVKEQLGAQVDRIAVVEMLAASPEVRVRAAGAEAAVSQLPDPRAEAVVRAALVDPDPAVVGNAAGGLAELAEKAPAWVAPLLVERARAVKGKDSELYQTMIETLGAIKSPEARAIALEASTDPDPSVRAKALAVLKELGEPTPAPQPSAPARPLPPVDVKRVIGKKPVLTVETNRGVFRVELDPDVAPWNSANLVTLAEKGFFDGTLWHRVVPGFVVQGGDPTSSGWGGPGYTVPGEPSARPFVRGSVGIADAGKDTGGSQWFVTLVATPHLDGRYSLIGEISEADMAIVDTLQVGDRIVGIKVEP